MFHIFWKGLLVGILIAAPIGPVSLLCVQKTIYKGRWHGFFSGLGSSISDSLYAAITCAWFGIAVHFVEQNQIKLQILCCFLLLGFGIYTLFKNPTEDLKKLKTEIKTKSYYQDFLTVFLLSFSNPFILFLLIGLFNNFHFLLSEPKLKAKIVGITCILFGNATWWLMVTYFISKLNQILTIRKLVFINKIIGILIIGLSLGVLVFFYFFKR